MKKVHIIDENGLYVEDAIIEDGEYLAVGLTWVDTPMPEGIFLPAKFENGAWTSLITEEEKQAIMNPETEPTKLDLMQKAIDDLILGGM